MKVQVLLDSLLQTNFDSRLLDLKSYIDAIDPFFQNNFAMMTTCEAK